MNIPQHLRRDPLTLPKPGRLRVKSRHAVSYSIEAMDLMQKCCADIGKVLLAESDPKTKAMLGSTLARLEDSWCKMVDTRRELLGKPKVGTLRPDMTPAKAGRARTIMVHDVQQPGNTCLDLIPTSPAQQNMVSSEPLSTQVPDDQGQRS